MISPDVVKAEIGTKRSLKHYSLFFFEILIFLNILRWFNFIHSPYSWFKKTDNREQNLAPPLFSFLIAHDLDDFTRSLTTSISACSVALLFGIYVLVHK